MKVSRLVKSPFAGCAALLVMTAVAYIPAMQGGYIWDDGWNIINNEPLRTWEGLRRIWFELGAIRQYYPLSQTGLWIQYQLWGLTPQANHVVNVLTHVLCAMLLWRALVRFQVAGDWFAAAFFALHPVHVESVAWLTEFQNMLSGAFFLATILVMSRFFRIDGESPALQPPQWREVSWARYFAGGALFLGAMLSKTAAITLAPTLPLLIWWKRGRICARDWVLCAPFFLVALALGMLTIHMEIGLGAEGGDWSLTPVEHVLLAGRIICFYAWKLLWPLEIMFNYPRWDIGSGAPLAWWWGLFPGGVFAVLGVLWALRNRIGRSPLAAALFFCGNLFPVLGFFNVFGMLFSWVADHWVYYPSMGLLALYVGAPAKWAMNGGKLRRIAVTMAAVVVLVFYGFHDWELGKKYENTKTHYRTLIAQNPNSFLAHYNLGVELLQENKLSEAIPHFHEALRIRPHYQRAYINLGIAHAALGNGGQAVKALEKGYELNPHEKLAAFNLALAYARTGNERGAMELFSGLAEKYPDDAQVLLNYGILRGRAGDLPGMSEYCERALELSPQDQTIQACVLKSRAILNSIGAQNKGE